MELAAASNFIGLAGVAIVLTAYIMLQSERLSAETLSFSVANLLGSLMIIVSLYYHWNLASFVIEIAWILASLYGISKWFRKKRAST